MEQRQLIMNWENDGTIKELQVGEDFKIVNLNQLDGAVNFWLDIVQDISGGVKDYEYYKLAMFSYPTYDANYCFFVQYKGVPVATITLILDYEKLHGYVHMVACKKEYRGLNIGNLLARIAEYNLKKAGMKTAHLTTDDWRLPAIKTYLNVGFKPDVSDDEYKMRWEKVMFQINNYNKKA